jgi:hypothetical protein
MALGLGLALTGCAATQGGAKEPPAQVLNIQDIDSFTLPLDAYSANPEQRLLLETAKIRVLARCLERLGLKAELPDPQRRPFRPNALRYGITSEARVKVLGYSVPEITKEPRRPELSPKIEQALSGKGPSTIRRKKVPEGGCAGEAGRILDAGTPDPKPDRSIVGRLSVATFERSVQDSRVRAVFSQWSACMKRSGYRYATPRDANRNKAFNDGRKHRVTELELGTAVADVRCKREADVVNVWAGVETAYQKLAIAQNRAALTAVRRAVDTRLKNAADLARA